MTGTEEPNGRHLNLITLKEHVLDKIKEIREYIESRFSAIREYIDAKFSAIREYVDVRMQAQEKATSVAYEAQNKRLEVMNELRGALDDLSKKMMLRTEVGPIIDAINKELRQIDITLRDQAARIPTRQELEAAVSIIERELRELRDFKTTMEAKASQRSVNIALVLSAIGLMVSVVRLFVK